MHKLQDNKWGPFSIVEMVGTQAARLDLPPSSRVHPVISLLHLQPFIEDTLGMGTRRPGTRQDLGPGTSRGLAEESRDVPRLYSCGPGTSRDPK